jgi:hypothetical protein
MQPAVTFESALAARVAEMADARNAANASIRPDTGGVTAEPRAVIGGVSTSSATAKATTRRKWRTPACSRANASRPATWRQPAFLAMTRTMARKEYDAREQRRIGVEGFRRVARDVTHISRLADDDCWRGSVKSHGLHSERPDFVFYTGCNGSRRRISRCRARCQDTIVDLSVMGAEPLLGAQMRTGDIAPRASREHADKLASGKSGQGAWCRLAASSSPRRRADGRKGPWRKPFEMTPSCCTCAPISTVCARICAIACRWIALHKHPGVPGVVEAAEDILRAVPGVGCRSLRLHRRDEQLFTGRPAPPRIPAEERCGRASRRRCTLAVYHADHRELCAHESAGRPHPQRAGTFASMVPRRRLQRLKTMNGVDAISRLPGPHGAHRLDPATTRIDPGDAEEQPLPMRDEFVVAALKCPRRGAALSGHASRREGDR